MHALPIAYHVVRGLYNLPDMKKKFTEKMGDIGGNSAISSFRTNPQEYNELLIMMLSNLFHAMAEAEGNQEKLKQEYLKFSNMLQETFLADGEWRNEPVQTTNQQQYNRLFAGDGRPPAEGGANKRKYKTRKYKTRKYKTRKYKTRKYKTRKYKTRKHNSHE